MRSGVRPRLSVRTELATCRTQFAGCPTGTLSLRDEGSYVFLTLIVRVSVLKVTGARKGFVCVLRPAEDAQGLGKFLQHNYQLAGALSGIKIGEELQDVG